MTETIINEVDRICFPSNWREDCGGSIESQLAYSRGFKQARSDAGYLYQVQSEEVKRLATRVAKLEAVSLAAKSIMVRSFKEFSDCADADYFDTLCDAINATNRALVNV